MRWGSQTTKAIRGIPTIAPATSYQGAPASTFLWDHVASERDQETAEGEGEPAQRSKRNNCNQAGPPVTQIGVRGFHESLLGLR